MYTHNGLNSNMGNLCKLTTAVTRSISPENFTGEKGNGATAQTGTGSRASRDLGKGFKVSPSVIIKPNETFEMANIEGSGAIKHIWLTPTGTWRNTILRMYWDNQENPSVESPIGDFFCSGWNEYAQLNSLAVCVNPGSAFNCYWEMPFKKNCKMTLTNRSDEDVIIYYQIDYILTEIQEDCAYFHAYFNRTNPLPYKEDYVILDNVSGKGQYVGTYMAWGVNNKGWWGEGEIKFFMDGDKEYPTICGTGTEDYFCGSYNFEDPDTHLNYKTYSTPYAGLHQVITPDKLYNSQFRFGLYRFHITDPIYFNNDLKVTIQALGWREGGRYLPLQDDIASVAFWYQTLPTVPFKPLMDKDYLEVI